MNKMIINEVFHCGDKLQMIIKRASNIEVKKINRNRTFRYISKFERISKPEIATALNVSTPTVLQNIKELIELGLVVESGEFKSTGGRKASAVSVVKNNHISIGIDITGHHIGMTACNLSGEILIHKRIYKLYENNDSYYSEMAEIINKFKNEHVKSQVTFLGYGFSIPGIINKDQTTILRSHVLGISNIKCNTFTKYIDDECTYINDANAAGFAEIFHDADHGNAAYISLSQSVGGAFIQAKREMLSDDPVSDILYMGDNNRSCEFGHMTLYPNGDKCYCGKYGCADTYCSSLRLSREADDILENFFTRMKSGDCRLEKIWDSYLTDLSILINTLKMSYDSKIIVGGYLGSFIEPYIDLLREKTACRNTFEKDASYIQSCIYKVESSALGAALVQIERFINSI